MVLKGRRVGASATTDESEPGPLGPLWYLGCRQADRSSQEFRILGSGVHNFVLKLVVL